MKVSLRNETIVSAWYAGRKKNIRPAGLSYVADK